jgi:Uncharacterized protein conserved in bacteria
MWEFSVTPGVPTDWASLAGDGPAAARARWIEFGRSWYPGPYQTLALRDPDGRCAVAMGGTVLPAPGPVPRRDPYHILTGRAAYLGLCADGSQPWPRDVDPAEVHPCLVLMYPNYATFPVGPGASDPEVLRHFVAEVISWAKDQGIRSIALLFMTPRADPLLAELDRSGFGTVMMGERCDLDVTWTDFDGYLRTLPSKRRVEVRRELRTLDDRGLVRSSRSLAADEPELLDLRCGLIAKYDGSADRAAEAAIFDQIREHVAPEDLTVFTVTDGDRLLSFSLYIQDGSEWTAMLTGSAYADPDASYGYFSTIFYQPIAEAANRGIRLISYGYGSLDTKRHRGCHVSPYHAAELRLHID